MLPGWFHWPTGWLVESRKTAKSRQSCLKFSICLGVVQFRVQRSQTVSVEWKDFRMTKAIYWWVCRPTFKVNLKLNWKFCSSNNNSNNTDRHIHLEKIIEITITNNVSVVVASRRKVTRLVHPKHPETVGSVNVCQAQPLPSGNKLNVYDKASRKHKWWMNCNQVEVNVASESNHFR